jgi:hypothetical protein
MTKVKPSTRKAKKSSSSVKSAHKPPSPSSSVDSEKVSSLWIKRRYDWQKREEMYHLMPHDFFPTDEDDESYIRLADFTYELVEDIEQEDEKKKLFESADLILNGTEWVVSKCSRNNIMILLNDDGDVSVSGVNWGIATYDGKTYLKKLEEEECTSPCNVNA